MFKFGKKKEGWKEERNSLKGEQETWGATQFYSPNPNLGGSTTAP
jgi:hypothetical protein